MKKRLVPVNLRLSSDDHARLSDLANQKQTSASGLLTKILSTLDDQTILNTLERRLSTKTPVKYADKRTSALTTTAVLDRFDELSACTEISRDALVRIALEAYFSQQNLNNPVDTSHTNS